MLAITQMSMGEAVVTAGLGIVVVMVVLALLAGIIVVMSKIINRVSAVPPAPQQPAPAPIAPAPAPVLAAPAPAPKGKPIPATQSQGTCELIAVDDQTAAMIMAIVADQMGEPLNTLRFHYIRRIN